MDRLLEEVSKPFFGTLAKWIFGGDLHDPFQEFFVQLNSDPTLRKHGRASPYTSGAGDMGFEGGLEAGGAGEEAGKVWEKKYIFVRGMVPGFVSEEFGKKVRLHHSSARCRSDDVDLFHWPKSQLYTVQLPRYRVDRDPSQACQCGQSLEV